MTTFLVAFTGSTIGFLAGVVACAIGQHQKAVDLERARLLLDLDRRNLRAAQNAFHDHVRRSLPATPQRPVVGPAPLKAGWLM